MAFKETCVMDQRQRFVFEALEPSSNMSALCRRYGISRKTGYKWVRRFDSGGIGALSDLSRRPIRHPLETTAAMAMEVIRLRGLHPTWGPPKLRVLLLRSYATAAVPSERTIGRLLQRSGMSRKRRRRSKGQRLKDQLVAEHPNDVWTIDFKGWWRTLDGSRCEPLTVRDEHSRYLLDVRALGSTGGDGVKTAMVSIFERYGLPKVIRSDNGSPFASARAVCGLTRLSVWWLSLGINLDRIDPGHPEQNGAHERMHRDIKAELQQQPAHDLVTQQERFDAWKAQFNTVRPHQALGQKTPASVYRISPRALPAQPAQIQYPANYEVRKVRRDGCIRWHAKERYLSQALAGWSVGIEPYGMLIRVWFADLCLGVTDEAFASPLRPTAFETTQAKL